jgi:hypothetical protein
MQSVRHMYRQSAENSSKQADLSVIKIHIFTDIVYLF